MYVCIYDLVVGMEALYVLVVGLYYLCSQKNAIVGTVKLAHVWSTL
jgi:hypothetical protein